MFYFQSPQWGELKKRWGTDNWLKNRTHKIYQILTCWEPSRCRNICIFRLKSNNYIFIFSDSTFGMKYFVCAFFLFWCCTLTGISSRTGWELAYRLFGIFSENVFFLSQGIYIAKSLWLSNSIPLFGFLDYEVHNEEDFRMLISFFCFESSAEFYPEIWERIRIHWVSDGLQSIWLIQKMHYIYLWCFCL